MTPTPATAIIATELADAEDRLPEADNDAFDWDELAAARTRTLDALAGFEEMGEHAEPAFAPVVAAFRDLHLRHADILTRILSDAGRAPDDEGSIMGTINQAVVATLALFDDIDADVLRQIHSGEEHVVSAYEAALDSNLAPDVHDQMSQLLVELQEILADTRPTR